MGPDFQEVNLQNGRVQLTSSHIDVKVVNGKHTTEGESYRKGSHDTVMERARHLIDVYIEVDGFKAISSAGRLYSVSFPKNCSWWLIMEYRE